MDDREQGVAATIAAYQEAVFAQDVDALMRLYDPAVRVFDAWGVWSYDGAPAWRKTVEAWLTSLGDDKVRVTVDDLQACGGTDLVVASAVFTYASVDDTGKPQKALQNRITWALRPGTPTWKIVHEHTSAPIGFDDNKAILRREVGA